ncbi:MAG: hypothetical protein U9R44_07440 [Candidatus Omnitrophota bacterium]|nr:hypothetical protein [Candidatus Omnitrophota bacterium]
MEKTKNWITDTIIIAAAPFMGYLFAFAFESGYAQFFKFPVQFITIGLSQVLLTIFILWGVFLMLFWFVELISSAVPKNRYFLSHSIERFIPLFGLLMGYSLLYGWSTETRVVIALILGLGFIEFIVPLITQGDKKCYEDKLEAEEGASWEFREKRGAFSVRLVKIFGQKYIMFILNVVILIVFTRLLGQIYASRTETFPVPLKSPDSVVLRIYGDKLICAKFNRKEKTIEPVFSIYNTTDPLRQELRLEKVGPLKPEKK